MIAKKLQFFWHFFDFRMESSVPWILQKVTVFLREIKDFYGRDLKIAKKVCSKDQKVIKVPNTNVFQIVSPILISRGISRIVSEEKLIALKD